MPSEHCNTILLIKGANSIQQCMQLEDHVKSILFVLFILNYFIINRFKAASGNKYKTDTASITYSTAAIISAMLYNNTTMNLLYIIKKTFPVMKIKASSIKICPFL